MLPWFIFFPHSSNLYEVSFSGVSLLPEGIILVSFSFCLLVQLLWGLTAGRTLHLGSLGMPDSHVVFLVKVSK